MESTGSTNSLLHTPNQLSPHNGSTASRTPNGTSLHSEEYEAARNKREAKLKLMMDKLHQDRLRNRRIERHHPKASPRGCPVRMGPTSPTSPLSPRSFSSKASSPRNNATQEHVEGRSLQETGRRLTIKERLDLAMGTLSSSFDGKDHFLNEKEVESEDDDDDEFVRTTIADNSDGGADGVLRANASRNATTLPHINTAARRETQSFTAGARANDSVSRLPAEELRPSQSEPLPPIDRGLLVSSSGPVSAGVTDDSRDVRQEEGDDESAIGSRGSAVQDGSTHHLSPQSVELAAKARFGAVHYDDELLDKRVRKVKSFNRKQTRFTDDTPLATKRMKKGPKRRSIGTKNSAHDASGLGASGSSDERDSEGSTMSSHDVTSSDAERMQDNARDGISISQAKRRHKRRNTKQRTSTVLQQPRVTASLAQRGGNLVPSPPKAALRVGSQTHHDSYGLPESRRRSRYHDNPAARWRASHNDSDVVAGSGTFADTTQGSSDSHNCDGRKEKRKRMRKKKGTDQQTATDAEPNSSVSLELSTQIDDWMEASTGGRHVSEAVDGYQDPRRKKGENDDVDGLSPFAPRKKKKAKTKTADSGSRPQRNHTHIGSLSFNPRQSVFLKRDSDGNIPGVPQSEDLLAGLKKETSQVKRRIVTNKPPEVRSRKVMSERTAAHKLPQEQHVGSTKDGLPSPKTKVWDGSVVRIHGNEGREREGVSPSRGAPANDGRSVASSRGHDGDSSHPLPGTPSSAVTTWGQLTNATVSAATLRQIAPTDAALYRKFLGCGGGYFGPRDQ